MQCPKCHSGNCQRLAVIYENGISSGINQYTNQPTAQSSLIQRIAPPEKREYREAGFYMIIALAMSVLLPQMEIGLARKILCFIGMVGIPGGIASFLFYRSFKYNSTVYPELFQEWYNQWLCHKCGTIYHQELY